MQMYLLFYPLALLALLLLLAAIANPYKLQMSLDKLLEIAVSDDVRNDLESMSDAWAGHTKVTKTQIRTMSLVGIGVGVGVAIGLGIIVAPALAILMGALVGLIGAYYPYTKFAGGVPKSLLYDLEREAPMLAGFMYRSRGVAGMSVQQSFSQFAKLYEDTQTGKIVSRIPETASVTKALIGLRFPSMMVPNWAEVVGTMDTISEIGDPEQSLLNLRDRIQEREVQYLRGLAKQKAFRAPIVTVLLLLLPLMGLILIPVMVQAAAAIGGI